MKKFLCLLSVLLILFAIAAPVFAESSDLPSEIPFSHSDEADGYDFNRGGDGDGAYFEPYFSDSDDIYDTFDSPTVVVAIAVAAVCMLLFLPLLAVMIVFIVLNSKAKKKIAEYERRINANMYGGFNSAQGNFYGAPGGGFNGNFNTAQGGFNNGYNHTQSGFNNGYNTNTAPGGGFSTSPQGQNNAYGGFSQGFSRNENGMYGGFSQNTGFQNMNAQNVNPQNIDAQNGGAQGEAQKSGGNADE